MHNTMNMHLVWLMNMIWLICLVESLGSREDHDRGCKLNRHLV